MKHKLLFVSQQYFFVVLETLYLMYACMCPQATRVIIHMYGI